MLRRSAVFLLAVAAVAANAAPAAARIQRIQSSPDRVIRYCSPGVTSPAVGRSLPNQAKCAPIATGDFNADGRDDAVFLALTQTARSSQLQGFQRKLDIHAGPFSAVGEAERAPMASLSLSDGAVVPSIAVGDYDGDGIDDLVFAEAVRGGGTETQRVSVVRGGPEMVGDMLIGGASRGSYVIARAVTLQAGAAESIQGRFPIASNLRPRLADIDGDGAMDLLLSVDPAIADIRNAMAASGMRNASMDSQSKEAPSHVVAFLDTPGLAARYGGQVWNVAAGDESVRIDGLGACESASLLGIGDVTGDGSADVVLRRCPGAGVPDMLGLVTGRRDWPSQLTIDGAVKARPNLLPPGPAPTADPGAEPPRGYVAFQPIPKSLFDQPSAFFIQDINLDGVADVGFGFSDKTHIWLGGPSIAARIKASRSDRIFLQAGFGGTSLSGTWRLSDLNGDKQVDLLLTQRSSPNPQAPNAVAPGRPGVVLGKGAGSDGGSDPAGGSLTEPIKIYVGARAHRDMLNLVDDSPDAMWSDPSQDLWLIGDFNGDGKDDVMVGTPGSSESSSYQIFNGPFIR